MASTNPIIGAKVATSAPIKLYWPIALTILMLGMLLGLTACSEPEGASEGGNPAPANGADASPAPSQAGTTEVSLTEYEIQMPASLAAGPHTFTVTNNGAIDHNFEIEGQGIEEEFDDDLGAGETETMQLDLEPGTYEVYCPVGNHRDMGMEIQLTVTQ